MKFYITTSIPYLNAPPHLGHALEYVQADAIARYMRTKNNNVFFLTGSDEHGAKIAKSAEAAKRAPQEFVDAGVFIFQNLLKKLGIDYSDFIRTSDRARHWPGAEALWNKMREAGDIEKGQYRGLYCIGHEAFITEKDMVDGICAIHKKSPEEVNEENYFFKLLKYKAKLNQALSGGEIKIFPEFRKQEVLNMVESLEDISFSRPAKDLSWGIPVPGDSTQTMYVWADALSNYISALGFGSSNDSKFKEYWESGEQIIHVIGKDILKFHSIFWPAMLMSAGLRLPTAIFVHGFINNKGEKMSKSIGNVIDPFPLIEKYGTDAVRFYLLSQTTFGDSDFSEDHFHDTYNGVLVGGLGNLLSRTLKMMMSFPEISKSEDNDLNFLYGTSNIYSSIDKTRFDYEGFMKNYEIVGAVSVIFQLQRNLDEYIEKHKVYKLLKENSEGAKVALWNLAYALTAIARMLKPFLPETSDKILNALGVDPNSKESPTTFVAKEVIHLFPRIEK